MAPPLTLHHLHIGQSERIVWLLEELALPYTLRLHTRVPLFGPPALKSLTPMGSAPVLTSSTPSGKEFNISETGAIVEYLLNVHASPEKRDQLTLKPTDEEYVDYLFWLHWANGSLQPALMRQMIAKRYESQGDSLISQMASQGLEKHLKALDARLNETGAWLAGSKFSAAETVTVWCVTTMRQFCPFTLSPYPAILAWLGRVAEREAYARAMEKCEQGYDWREGMTEEGPGEFMRRGA
jgi:glutathione S-transferase